MRDIYYREAANLFQTGNGMLANELSQTGSKYHNKIKEIDEKYRDNIFNKSLQSNNSKIQVVDLHGLQVKNALNILIDVISTITKSQTGFNLLEVVTGKGKHSQGGQARIKPAVLSFFREKNFKFKEINEGAIIVLLDL